MGSWMGPGIKAHPKVACMGKQEKTMLNILIKQYAHYWWDKQYHGPTYI